MVLFLAAKSIKQFPHIPKLKISVIIPVRNEEHNISRLLSDLAKQTYDVFEIICVDDDSTDRTCEVIKNFDVEIISSGALPEGWKGKPWACQQGAEHASGDVLLFFDADVRLHQKAVSALASAFTFDNSCVSVQPYHQTNKAYEQFSLFFNAIQAMGTGMGIPFKTKRIGVFGPVFMVSRNIFLSNQGYLHVKGETIEDYSLGRYYNEKNIDLKLFLGGGYISYRMYPLGFCSLVEGWAKNFATGAIKTKWWRLIMIVVYITALTALPIEIVKSIMHPEVSEILFASVFYLLFVIFLLFSSKKLGSFKVISCVFYPVVLFAFHLIFLYSVVCTFVTKSATWKGRKV